MKKFKHVQLVLVALLASALVWSCKDKNEVEVLSGFSYAVDQADFRKVTFTNTSSGYTSVTWDFGDGSATSTEENPVHTYQALGTYTVTLTATGSDNSTNVSSQEITISDPDAELTKLAGIDSKTWKLIRVTGPGVWPLEVGPASKDQVWWAMGRDNDEIANRPCIMNDEYTFTRSGQYIYNSNGDFWAEGGVFSPANLCQETNAANLKGENGEDLSAFGDGTHAFVLTSTPTPKLEVKGLGAYIGLPKIGTDSEVKVPQNSVVYDIVKLTDGNVDTLVLNVDWKFPGNTSGADDAYWKITLVHYDNAADEPGIPLPKPVAGFTGAIDGLRIDFTNTSTNALTYSWDFGDGSSSTQANPSHTYAAAGAFTVVLTATNDAGSSSFSQEFTVTSGSISEADLIGGAWKIRNSGNSIFVGPGLGSNAWWGVPANFLDGSSSGQEDWSCMVNDEFIFSAGGVYEYKTNGDARNDGYMGSPNGCWSDAQVAASGNGAAFGSAVHSFTFTPADGTNRPIITLTNGSFGAAFVGFYKGYYGGENSNSANPPNGGATTNRYEVMSYLKANGVETLTLSVDISADKNGSAAWTVVLTR